jgi:hypothetical protein
MDEKCRTETCITTYGYVFIQTISGRAVLCATFFIQAMSGLSSIRENKNEAYYDGAEIAIYSNPCGSYFSIISSR